MSQVQNLSYHDKLFPMNQFSVIREDGKRVYLFAVQYGPTSQPDTDYVVYTKKVKLFSSFDVYAACFDRRADRLKIWPIEDEATWQSIKLNLSAVKNAGELLRTPPAEVVASARGSKAKYTEKYPGAELVPAPERRRKALSQREKNERIKIIFPDKRLVLTDDKGFRTGYDVLMTMSLDNTGKDYVAYTDGSKDGNKTAVYVSVYDIWADLPMLSAIESEEEWEQIEQFIKPLVKEIKWQNKK